MLGHEGIQSGLAGLYKDRPSIKIMFSVNVALFIHLSYLTIYIYRFVCFYLLLCCDIKGEVM